MARFAALECQCRQEGFSLPSRSSQVSRLTIWTALGSVYLIWGSTYLAIRFAIETLPPFLFAAVRFLVAGVLLYAVRRARGDARPSAQEWRSAAIVGVMLLAAGNGGVVWAEQWIPSGLAALLIGTTPLWIVLLDWLRPFGWLRRDSGGGRPHPRALLGVVIGFAGVVLLIGGGGAGVDRLPPVAAGVLLLATLSWATGSL